MDIIDLSFFFKTKSEASDFASRLDLLGERIYQTDFDLEKTLAEILGLRKKDKFLAILHENNIDLSSPASLKDFLGKIIELIKGIPVLSMTLAFEPDEKTLEIISEWFLINLKKQAIFEINVDRKLIAGAVLYYNGKYQDYSVKPKIDEIISKSINKPTTPSSDVGHQGTEHITLAR